MYTKASYLFFMIIGFVIAYSAYIDISKKLKLFNLNEQTLVQYYDAYFDQIEKDKRNDRLTRHLHLGLFPLAYKGQSLEELQNEMVYESLKDLCLKENVLALDVGCGLGGPMHVIFQKNATIKIDGIDILDRNLIKARELLLNGDIINRCRLIKMDAHKMDFESNAYDYVFALETLENMDQRVVLKEIFRVLKNNGILCFCDFYERNNLEESEITFLRSKEHINLINIDNYNNLLSKIGFQVIECTELTDQIYLNFKHFYPESNEFLELIENKKVGYVRVKAIAKKPC